MSFKLSGSPTVEQHSENLIHLFVRDANGVPVPNARVKVWAGQPPAGSPVYWNDDVPFRPTSAAGMLEFITVTGPMPDSRDYWMQVFDNTGAAQSDPVQFHFPRGSTIWITATLTQEGSPSPKPVPAATLEQAALTAAQKYTWMPINTDGALYKFALANHLGYPQTDEFELTFGSDTCVGQVYNGGIVYVKKGDWGNIKWVEKP